MERLTASQARDNFATVVNRVAFGRERLVIQRRGKDMVALISMEDLVYLMTLEEREDVDDAKQALAEPERTSWKAAKEKLGL
jgi:prevent-host-death family protein